MNTGPKYKFTWNFAELNRGKFTINTYVKSSDGDVYLALSPKNADNTPMYIVGKLIII